MDFCVLRGTHEGTPCTRPPPVCLFAWGQAPVLIRMKALKTCAHHTEALIPPCPLSYAPPRPTLPTCASAQLLRHPQGLRKPDQACYQCAVDVLGVSPAELIFVDDRPANVDAVGFEICCRLPTAAVARRDGSCLASSCCMGNTLLSPAPRPDMGCVPSRWVSSYPCMGRSQRTHLTNIAVAVVTIQAKEYGLQAVLFTGAEELQQELRVLGVDLEA